MAYGKIDPKIEQMGRETQADIETALAVVEEEFARLRELLQVLHEQAVDLRQRIEVLEQRP